MIAQLTGNLVQKGDDFIVLNVGGVGYRVFVPEIFLSGIEGGSEITLFTHLYIRENAQELYGFESVDELEMFEMLISISGIGPKAGIAILSHAAPEEVKRAIATGDISTFTKVSGVGKKTAERVVLELKSKVEDFEITEVASTRNILPSNEALDALVALGCSEQEARQALRSIDAEITKTEDQVKEALKLMGAH